MSWSISVKTVGNNNFPSPSATSTSSSSSSSSPSSPTSATPLTSPTKDFTIQVEPNEVLSSLHRKIEAKTGLKSSQQRLIYRGRLISSGCPSSATTTRPSTSATDTQSHPDAHTDTDADTHTTRSNSTSLLDNEATAIGTNGGGNHSHSDNDNDNTNSDAEQALTQPNTSGVNDEAVSHDRNTSSNDTNPINGTSNADLSNGNNAQDQSSSSATTSTIQESRICDVVGLSDGQTIHLVPRPSPPTPINNNSNHDSFSTSTANLSTTTITSNNNSTSNNSSDEDESNSNSNNNGSGNNGNGGGASGAGLLAALLGLGSSSNNNTNNTNNRSSNNNNNNDDSDTMEGLETALSSAPPSRLRNTSSNTNNNTSTSTSSTSRRRNPHSYRRNENDPLYPDPCPLEPVRQGLMTLHTMIGEDTMNNKNNHDDIDNDNDSSKDVPAPVSVPTSTSTSTTSSDKVNPNKSKNNHPQSCLSSSSSSPLNFQRKWYIGQWLDCRDTVNQWLEATVTDIVCPRDLIHSVPKKTQDTTSTTTISTKTTTTTTTSDDENNENNEDNTNTDHYHHRITQPYIDPAIGANDLEGRTKLLLEPAEDENDTTLSAHNNNDESLVGYQERKHNSNIQLLKIHYNGWPHRWDEWIRSDSERIRPFRTRSRHVPASNYYNPSPQSVYRDSPATFVVSDDDEVERLAVVPELYNAIDVVQSMFEDATNMRRRSSFLPTNKVKQGCFDDEDDDMSHHTVVPLTKEEQDELSNVMKNLQPEKVERVMNIINNDGEGLGGKSVDIADVVVEELENDVQHKLFYYLIQRPRRTSTTALNSSNEDEDVTMLPWREGKKSGRNFEDPSNDEINQAMKMKLKKLNKQKLEALAPLLDRLGRVLVDFAPHVASIAESLPKESLENEPIQEEDGDGESINVDESNHEEVEAAATTVATSTTTASPSFANSFIPLRPSWSLSRDHTSESTTPLLSSTEANGTDRSGEINDVNDENNNEIDPDYVDFVNGFINPVSRGEPPRRSVRRSNSDNFGSSLLSAFLASNVGGSSHDDNEDGNGPRVLRLGGSTNGGTGNGGIDIHIHAIVTGPNGGIAGAAGLDGLAGLMSPPTTTTTTSPVVSNVSSAAAAVAHTVQEDDDEELGLFSDLYAESGQSQNNTATNTSNTPFDGEVEIADEGDGVSQLLSDDDHGIMSNSMDSIGSNRHESASRRPSSSNSTGSNSASSRRGQMFGRIFRRAMSRRSNNN